MVLEAVLLAALFIKQFSRPVVNTLTEAAKNHERFRFVMRRIGLSKIYITKYQLNMFLNAELEHLLSLY